MNASDKATTVLIPDIVNLNMHHPNEIILIWRRAHNVLEAIERRVNAIWPGCDLWLTVPKENMEALMAASNKYGKIN